MAAKWQIGGEYFETCSCDYLCPCVTTNLAARPTKGHCDFAMVFHVDKGRYDGVSLDDLYFAVLGHTPGVMGEGQWSVGLILDERARPEQQEALTAIASGQAGGPMAPLAPMIKTFLGAETRPFRVEKSGLARSVSIPGVLDQAIEGVPSPVRSGEALCVDNTLHPANPRLGLARAVRSVVNALGLQWEDRSGKNNGHLAPFSWQG